MMEMDDETGDDDHKKYLGNLGIYDRILTDQRLGNDDRKEKLGMLRKVSEEAFVLRFGTKSIDEILKENEKELDPAEYVPLCDKVAPEVFAERTKVYTDEALRGMVPQLLAVGDATARNEYLDKLKKTHLHIFEENFGPVLQTSPKVTSKPAKRAAAFYAEKSIKESLGKLKKK